MPLENYIPWPPDITDIIVPPYKALPIFWEHSAYLEALMNEELPEDIDKNNLKRQEYYEQSSVLRLTECVSQALRDIEKHQSLAKSNAVKFFSEELLCIIEQLEGVTYEVTDEGIMLLFIAGQLFWYIPNGWCFWFSSKMNFGSGEARAVKKISFVKTDHTGRIIDPRATLATAPIDGSTYTLSIDTALDDDARASHTVPENDPNWTDVTPEEPYQDS